MKVPLRFFFFYSVVLLSSCSNYGQLKVNGDLSKSLKEASAVEAIAHSNLIWIVNDSGNKNEIYGISKKAKLKKVFRVNHKNNDWEDLTSDAKGNLYIGDFGNNLNTRRDLAVLKINRDALIKNDNIEVERIAFYFPEQLKFPPKKKKRFFDTEAFFFHNDSLFLFTRSRVKGQYGNTSLYKIPAKIGYHKAIKISEFSHCKKHSCSITSADISPDGQKVVLLSSASVLLFENFETDDFFSGHLREIPLTYKSQKEGICFKNDSTLYITDEKSGGRGGNFYSLKID